MNGCITNASVLNLRGHTDKLFTLRIIGRIGGHVKNKVGWLDIPVENSEGVDGLDGTHDLNRKPADGGEGKRAPGLVLTEVREVLPEQLHDQKVDVVLTTARDELWHAGAALQLSHDGDLRPQRLLLLVDDLHLDCGLLARRHVLPDVNLPERTHPDLPYDAPLPLYYLALAAQRGPGHHPLLPLLSLLLEHFYC